MVGGLDLSCLCLRLVTGLSIIRKSCSGTKFSVKSSYPIAFIMFSVLLFSGVSMLVSHFGGGEVRAKEFLHFSKVLLAISLLFNGLLRFFKNSFSLKAYFCLTTSV